MSTTVSFEKKNDSINILLLGETGVGKSTFINAFVNYITYATLDEAESNQPIVAIPVSFIMTSGENFKEHRVQFNVYDKTDNEDFDHTGQSVTQRCQTHVFRLNHLPEKNLCIIDTPGFGDTRGVDQDDLNMQHILEYICHLTHLHAICFLLKPNVLQLNNYFRTCLDLLFDLLGPQIRQNIIFCFTNTRSTFYAPGDTRPILKTMLQSLPRCNIPFQKENTFCFDNESFRYLVALRKSIQFSDLDRKDYENSWSKSAMETRRFIDSIANNQLTCYISQKRKSNTHAQITIIHLIRPLLESIRNTLRNIILIKMGTQNTSVNLIPKAIDLPNSFCLVCKPALTSNNVFSFLPNFQHSYLRNCSMCKCVRDQHIPIDYMLTYEVKNDSLNYDENDLFEHIILFTNAAVELSRYLKVLKSNAINDLFLIGLMRIIVEEKYICSQSSSMNQFNVELVVEVEKIKNRYEQRVNEINLDKNSIELPVIYERIRITREYPDVKKQMDVMETGQKNIMKFYEHEISTDSKAKSTGILTSV